MLEGLATWFLNNYLGHYLEDLNTDQLSIALLQGEVELNSVPLRRDALRYVNSALDVRAGIVGKIRLKIPVSRLRSEPWILVLEDVSIVVGPTEFQDFDPAAFERHLLELKLSALDGIEAQWRNCHDKSAARSSYYPSYASWMSYGTSLIGTVIENLQIHVHNVHLRYEQDSLCAGLVLESLTAETCDENWQHSFVHRTPLDVMSYKLVELSKMAVYLSGDNTDMLGQLPVDELSQRMREGYAEQHFMLRPVSAVATVKRNCSEKPLTSKRMPRVRVDLNLDSIPLELSDEQYQGFISISRSLYTLSQSLSYWKWRPADPLNQHDPDSLRAWWHYAITCHMEQISDRNEAHSWSSALRKARENVAYVAAFKAYLENPVTLDPELKQIKLDQDRSRSYEELRALRELAVYYLKKEQGHVDDESSAQNSPVRDNPFFVDDSSPENENEDADEAEEEQPKPTLLQSYFGWGGWGTATATANEEADPEEAREATSLNYSSLEEELLEVLSDEASIVPYKDLVFAQLSFRLKEGSLRLYSQRKTLFELAFSDMQLELETRPRTKSYKFGMTLGGMTLRDMITRNSLFPFLVSPQSTEGAPLFPTTASSSSRGGGSGGLAAGIAKTFQTLLSSSGSSQLNLDVDPLFYVLCETRPFSSPKTDFKLRLRSQPLNLVYNPTVFQRIADFFQLPTDDEELQQQRSSIRSAAFERLQAATARTKQELVRNLHSILDGESFERKKWDIVIDLSAPQILIPEHFSDRDALIMVVDLGKFQLTNAKESTCFNAEAESNDNNDDNDEFVTPVSTPPSGTETPRAGAAAAELGDQAVLLNNMYDYFRVNLTGMQVILGKMKNDWRRAHIKGMSSMHLLDKFSISLQCQRRTLRTSDADFPNLVISGTLHKLVVHFNEDKIFALERIARLLFGDDTRSHDYAAAQASSVATQTDDELPLASSEELDQLTLFSEWCPEQVVDENSRLLLVQFSISEMSVELQSQEKSLAELQVTGVRASLIRRPYDTNVTMSVHSLLLVDAVQTFGPNFDLLLASHRHVTVDSVSGSLLGSEPVSPMSPMSPGSPEGADYLETSPHDIKKALSSLQTSQTSTSRRALSPAVSIFGAPSPRSPRSPGTQLNISPDKQHSSFTLNQKQFSPIAGMEIRDPDALILIEVRLLSPDSPSLASSGNSSSAVEAKKEKLRIVDIQFNSLDVIANQETIIELLAFFKKVAPAAATEPTRHGDKKAAKSQGTQTDHSASYGSSSINSLDQITHTSEKKPIGTKIRTELVAEFQRLNVLLLRAVTGKMIGTALLTEARISATVGSSNVSIHGSLGGLQVMNLLSGSTLHQKIISVGRDPMIEEYKGRHEDASSFQTDMYKEGKENEDTQQALNFSLKQFVCNVGDDNATPKHSLPGTPSTEFHLPGAGAGAGPRHRKQQVDLTLHMASVCYVHSAVFLDELNSCAADFKDYMSNLAHSIRLAATEIALGIVHRRAEALSHHANMEENFGTLAGNSPTARRNLFPPLAPGTAAPAPTPSKAAELELRKRPNESKINFYVNMVMKTPILVMPRHERSFEVLVAQLGEITLRNQIVEDDLERLDRVIVNVADMNLHSVSLNNKYDNDDFLQLLSQFKQVSSQQLYSCNTDVALPILHDTAIELKVERRTTNRSMQVPESMSYNSFVFAMDDSVDLQLDEGSSSAVLEHYDVQGRIMNPLKVSLCRSQYEQLVDSVHSLSQKHVSTRPSRASKTSNRTSTTSNRTSTTSNRTSTNQNRTSANLTFTDTGSSPSAANTNRASTTLDSSSTGPNRASSHTDDASPSSHVHGSFRMPELIVELCAEEKQRSSLVRLECDEFTILYDKREQHKSHVEVVLKQLIMADMQLAKESKHRLLMTSSAAVDDQDEAGAHNSSARSHAGLSTSCPEYCYFPPPPSEQQQQEEMEPAAVFASGSLPSMLDVDAIFKRPTGSSSTKPSVRSNAHQRQPSEEMATRRARRGFNPSTPPPSAVSSRASPVPAEELESTHASSKNSSDNLVHIQVVNMDSRVADFVTKHNCTHRYVDVDFSTLDINFNLQTWVIIFDFFGIIGGGGGGAKKPHANSLAAPKSNANAAAFNTEIDVKVKSLSVVLNNEYEVACVSVQKYSSRLSLRDGNFAVRGRLGSFGLKDLTKHSALYKDRFLCRQGENHVLTFHMFKYGQVDEQLLRPYDALLELRMASVIYVHTHRFYSEVVSFFFQLERFQNAMSRMREAAAGGHINQHASRGLRLKLDIEAGAPLLLLPMSSYSNEMLAVDLGALHISNSFRFSGDEGTISAETLSSVGASAELLGQRRRRHGSSSVSVRSQSSGRSSRRAAASAATAAVDESADAVFLPEKCLLDVLQVQLSDADLRCAERLSAFVDVESNLDVYVGSFIARLDEKALLKDSLAMRLQIERNLDKALTHRVPDMSVRGVLSKLHCVVDVRQYTLIRGLLAYNFGEPLDDLDFQVQMSEAAQDPTTNTILTGKPWTGIFMDFDLQDVLLDLKEEPHSLARVNFIKSRLVFESLSDNSKDVELVSQEIVLTDLRYADCAANQRPTNVFTSIMLPMQLAERQSPLQAQVHFRSTRDTNRFTILITNMRVMGIFDWWIAVLDFIAQSKPMPEQLERLQAEMSSKSMGSRAAKNYSTTTEPLYFPSSGVISRRAPVVESDGPVFELNLNITDSELLIVADASQSDCSTVILRSTTGKIQR